MAAARELVIGLRRAPLLSVLSVVTIAFALFAVGLFGLVALNIQRTLGAVEERVEIRAFVADGTPGVSTASAMTDIAAFPEVASVNYVSQQEALEQARRELGEFSDVFEAGFLPASFEVRLNPGFRSPQAVESVAERIRTYAFIEDVRYGEEWVQRFYDIRNVAAATGLVLGVAFAAVAVIIIGTTIRMTVMARAHEIAIMRLVGATDGYVRRPFLLDGVVKGIAGGALALLLTWGASVMITRYIVPAEFFEPRLIVFGLIAGATIGLLGSLVSVSRHLRRI